ncbi:MAG: NTP transferase domain-containing protein, partial [Victivallales bacterium]|nr:NTP transferase domain-containing protein [Victivallales bacterium]
MSNKAPLFSVVLAAGKGTRMRSAAKHKVCFEIDGVPAINRALRIYNDCGIKRHSIVVGAMAEQVMDTVGSCFDNAFYAYQKEQLGTANAVRVGIAPLEELPGSTDIFVVAGDRIIDQSLLEAFFNDYYTKKYDFALLTVPNQKGSGQGRIVLDDLKKTIAITEIADIRQRETLGRLRAAADNNSLPSSANFADFLKAGYLADGAAVPSDEKLSVIYGDIWQSFVVDGEKPTVKAVMNAVPIESTRFEYPGRHGEKIVRTPTELKNSEFVNNSVYITKLSALRYALSRLDRNNAQQEEYLSDVVSILASAQSKGGKEKFKIGMHNVDDRKLVLGFNDPAELLDIENTIRAHGENSPGNQLSVCEWYRTIGDWRRGLQTKSGKPGKEFINEIKELYSDSDNVAETHLRNYSALLESAESFLGADREAFLVRSPGRVNVMGRHIDHQGGNCNLMTIGYESLLLVAPREDDIVRMLNCDSANFAESEFSIGEMLVDLPWDDWLSLVNSDKLNKMINTYGVDWSNYLQASILRLQKKFSHRKLRGMDIVVWGNIPMAAGLSSSSSLVVGAAQAVVTANELNTFPAQLVTLCGEGEWFVGTRGGSADHAAVMLGQKGKVVRVGFFDFAVEEIVDFPDNHVMVVCDSGIKAEKTSNAKDQFNHRITCYRVGLLLIHKYCPQYSHLINHLRDVNMRNLRLPLSWIYKILLHLPEQATQEELRALLPNEDLDTFFKMHKAPADGLYPIRGVVMFGLAECERSRLYSKFLSEKRMKGIGELMNVSHNGDRVAKQD